MSQSPATSSSEAVGDAKDSVTAAQPLVPENLAASPSNNAQDQSDNDTGARRGMMAPTNKKKRKKGGKKPSARGPTALPRNRGSGFEEYYADPPMTPQEASEEQMEIYAGDLPFEERIQSCIQRFRSRRRLQGTATLYFNEYLFLGGVDTNPGAFTGNDPRDLKDSTPAERRDATATDLVYSGSAGGDRFYNGDKEHWSVDFSAVAAGFFSTAVVYLTGLEHTEVNTAIGVVENFLRYVLHHDVCPEHTDDIKEALRLCDVAREEWPMLVNLKAALPGQFNLAAAEIFTGSDASDWAFHGFARPEKFDAKSVFYSAFALMDERELFARLCDSKAPEVAREFTCTLEVVAVLRATDQIIERFRSVTLDEEHAHIAPVGKARLKPALIEDNWDHVPQPSPFAGGSDAEVMLFFDDAVLSAMKPGMKMALTLCELDVGVTFVKTIAAVVPSFYMFLPQEMMRHYKAPRPSERPAPSVNDPDANEKQLAKEKEG